MYCALVHQALISSGRRTVYHTAYMFPVSYMHCVCASCIRHITCVLDGLYMVHVCAEDAYAELFWVFATAHAYVPALLHSAATCIFHIDADACCGVSVYAVRVHFWWHLKF